MSSAAWNNLLAALPDQQRKLERRALDTLGGEFAHWHAQARRGGTLGADDVALADFLGEAIRGARHDIDALQIRHARAQQLVSAAASEEERRQQLLAHAAALGADEDQLAGDAAALERWFGSDALADRAARAVALLERKIAVALKLLGIQAQALLKAQRGEAPPPSWERLAIEATVRDLFAFEGHPRVRVAAFRCLADALLGLDPQGWSRAVAPSTSQYLYRCALDARQPVWLQADAIDLLHSLAPQSFLDVVRIRLTRPRGGDDLFVRRRATLLAVGALALVPEAADLLDLARADASPFVRQGLARALAEAPAAIVRRVLPDLLEDAVPQVRAQALLTLAAHATHATHATRGADGTEGALPLLDWLARRLATDQDSFVLRTALHVAEPMFATLAADQSAALARDIRRLHASAADLRVRRWAAQALVGALLASDPALKDLVARLEPEVRACRPGSARRLPRSFDAEPAERLGLAALQLTRADYPLDFERDRGRWRIQRGHRFGFRLWRVIHELRHPSPDKRQAFRHTIGRIFRGNLRVPSPILAELAQTKVPGEPLHYASEAGWRPYLPLVDELLSSLDLPASQQPLRIVTAEGITEIAPPRSLLARLKMRAGLIRDFPALAQARIWSENSQQAPGHYVEMLRARGFEVRFTPHAAIGADSAVQRFFPAGFAFLPGNEELWTRFQTYFFSVYGNSLFELLLFVCLALLAFLARHQFANRRLRRARRQLPLVIGGWGTRGKSGTERLKAAVFNALGYGVVSKTTGCEAMFLHCHPHQALREMFLFRPYDKATIWEQHNVTCLASELEADVFLWECMALTPAFVQLLQRRWMRDDLSTITNTFPDHEDLQGPAGINIPEVMTNFIPEASTLLTSEEQMRPILATAAADQGTQLAGVGWLESGLLTPDVLARFPYQEHPDNIALVVRMAAELGIPDDFALKEMADNVVPDLGVLKVYPEAPINGRTLSFANGMSANERYGCLGNWLRLGFERDAVDAEPAVMISTVVNNRADRIARSRVFAGVLVRDISADRHFLIGSNLEGLNGYIRESWLEYAAELTLWPEGGEGPQAVLESMARRMRLPFTAERLHARLAAMLGPELADRPELVQAWDRPDALAAALGPDAAYGEEVVAFLREGLLTYGEYRAFAERLASAPSAPDGALDEEFRELLWRWFERKLVTVADYYATGDRVVEIIASHTPPRFHNRVMGIQNIKGTGLDFVYRWQAWAQCHAACSALRATDPATFRRGLAQLGAFQEYGLLCEGYVRASLEIARHAPHAQLALVQSQLGQIGADLERALAKVREHLGAKREQGWLERLVMALEGFVDAGDAVRRRETANRIYADLVAQRISHARAAVELLRLTQRQKGGWLYDSMRFKLRLLADHWRELFFAAKTAQGMGEAGADER